MNEDTLTEILLQSNVNEYPRLAQTNQYIYKILNSSGFWLKKYNHIGLNSQIFNHYTAGDDLQDFIDEYIHVIKRIKQANIILWILNIEANDKKFKHLFIRYDVEYDIDYLLSLKSSDQITIKKIDQGYSVTTNDERENRLNEYQTKELLIMILYEGNTIFDNQHNDYFSPGRRYGLKQAYKYVTKL